MRTLNLGILAHVDAGKTTLTEQLLHAASVIDSPGNVDAGTTHTDTLALERQRGITIQAAVVSFELNGVTVNLVDTPGHPDFIAEVERPLHLLDGVVLVVSAVEGVQAQTQVLMKVLQRLKILTLMFVNKIDRTGAQERRLLSQLSSRLSLLCLSMGEVEGLGEKTAPFRPFDLTEPAFTETLVNALSTADSTFLADFLVNGFEFSPALLLERLTEQVKAATLHPVYFGSALKGIGVQVLMRSLTRFLPTPDRDAQGQVAGTVFKIDRGRNREKIASLQLTSGAIRVRDLIETGRPVRSKITAIRVYERGRMVDRDRLSAGQIGHLWGLTDAKIGDIIGQRHSPASSPSFSPPVFETVIVPEHAGDEAALHLALSQLAEQDPQINFRQDDEAHELRLSLYGEVQKEVIAATLAQEFHLATRFTETLLLHIERPAGTGEVVERLGKGQPLFATVGLRIEPGLPGSGVAYGVSVEPGCMPPAFFNAVEDTVRDVLRQGLSGWEVADCRVTLTEAGYSAPSSVAADFRMLTPLVLMTALSQAGTVVCEPIFRFHLDVPTGTLNVILPALSRHGGILDSQAVQGTDTVLEGFLPAASGQRLLAQIRALTQGEGVLSYTFDHYAPATGQPATKVRLDVTPLDRKAYLQSINKWF